MKVYSGSSAAIYVCCCHTSGSPLQYYYSWVQYLSCMCVVYYLPKILSQHLN